MRRVLILSMLAALSGCGGGLTVHAEVLQPARVPVRVFPRIVVVEHGTEESRRVARVVAEHLSGGASEVALVPENGLARARRSEERRATAVVHVEILLTTLSRTDWGRREEMVCGPLGCMPERRQFLEEVPLIEGRLRIEVRDGATDRLLQQESLSDNESGPDEMALRLRVLERLTNRATELLDQREERVAVPLLPVDEPRVREALEAIRRGRWSEGRRALEEVAGSPSFETLARQQRAWILYDLGQATRFDASIPAEPRLRESARLLRDAIRLSPEPRLATALDELMAHRRSRAMVQAQEAATVHNFALATPPEGGPALGVPEPPSSYRE